MWFTPCSTSSSSALSASRLETAARAAAPKIARLESWPVAPKGARSIMAAGYALGPTHYRALHRARGPRSSRLVALTRPPGEERRQRRAEHDPRRQPSRRALAHRRAPEPDDVPHG